MREIQKKEIDGVSYGLYPLNPFKSLPILTRLLKILGPTILKLIVGNTGGEKKSISKVMEQNVDGLLADLADNADRMLEKIGEDEIEKMMSKMLVNGLFFADDQKVMNLNTHFGNHGVFHLLKVFKFALEVNFKDFLPESAGIQG